MSDTHPDIEVLEIELPPPPTARHFRELLALTLKTRVARKGPPMSSSGQRTHLKLVTVGDFDPQSDRRSSTTSSAA
jgi:hypothetical protein